MRLLVALAARLLLVPRPPAAAAASRGLIARRGLASSSSSSVAAASPDAAAAASPPFSSSSSAAAAASAAAGASDVPGVSGGGAGAEAAPALMVVVYTCRVCESRSARRVSRAAYERGSVLLRCPGCRGLHVLSDHLGYFDDGAVDAAALLERRGEVVRRGALGGDANTLELTADDLRVLRAPSKGVRLADGAELPVVNMGPDVVGEASSVAQPGGAALGGASAEGATASK